MREGEGGREAGEEGAVSRCGIGHTMVHACSARALHRLCVVCMSAGVNVRVHCFWCAPQVLGRAGPKRAQQEQRQQQQ